MAFASIRYRFTFTLPTKDIRCIERFAVYRETARALGNEIENSDPEIRARKERTMRITTAMKASTLAAALGLACLLPATARAQADTLPDPDFFRISSAETAAAQTAPFARAKADFTGKFLLNYEVKCSGKTLRPGQYLLSVKSEGTRRVITIHGSGTDVNIQVRAASANRVASHSSLLVRKSGEGRRVEAVYVERLNATLYVESITSRGVTERLPIS